MENVLREPVELTAFELDAVAGGTQHHPSPSIEISRSNFVSVENNSYNLIDNSVNVGNSY